MEGGDEAVSISSHLAPIHPEQINPLLVELYVGLGFPLAFVAGLRIWTENGMSRFLAGATEAEIVSAERVTIIGNLLAHRWGTFPLLEGLTDEVAHRLPLWTGFRMGDGPVDNKWPVQRDPPPSPNRLERIPWMMRMLLAHQQGMMGIIEDTDLYAWSRHNMDSFIPKTLGTWGGPMFSRERIPMTPEGTGGKDDPYTKLRTGIYDHADLIMRYVGMCEPIWGASPCEIGFRSGAEEIAARARVYGQAQPSEPDYKAAAGLLGLLAWGENKIRAGTPWVPPKLATKIGEIIMWMHRALGVVLEGIVQFGTALTKARDAAALEEFIAEGHLASEFEPGPEMSASMGIHFGIMALAAGDLPDLYADIYRGLPAYIGFPTDIPRPTTPGVAPAATKPKFPFPEIKTPVWRTLGKTREPRGGIPPSPSRPLATPVAVGTKVAASVSYQSEPSEVSDEEEE